MQYMSMSRVMLLCCACAVSFAACTQFPDLDHTQTNDLSRAEYPALVPIDPILAATYSTPPDFAAENERLNARLAALRSRANRMRGSVLTGAQRQRLENGLQ